MINKEMLLLPHQYELLADTTTRIIGLCSGYGGGKTYSAARKAIHLATLNPGCDGIVTEPTFPLLNQVMFPELKKALDFFGIDYKFNKVESIFYCVIEGKPTRIICGSMENYERLIGINAAWVMCDEFDTSKAKIAYEAYIKLLGRLRAGNVRQFVIVSTPEGFRAMHKIFVTEKDESKRLIQAKTTDNKYLPQDYIDTLKAQYPPELLSAYLDGQFVNLTSGTVYNSYNRKKHNSQEVIKPKEPLYIGMDFNVTNMSAVVYVRRARQWHAVDELKKIYDTPAMIEIILERFTDHSITVYPDASGKSRKSVDASTSDISLLRSAGFSIRAKNSNPRVKDRIMATNSAFNKELLYINNSKCPEYSRCMEQLAYDPNGEPDKKSDLDHLPDAGTYPIAYEMPVVRPTTKAYRMIV